MSKFDPGKFIQDTIYGTTPWGIVDNAIGNPLARMHLSRVDSAAEDVTATVDPNDPNNHEINPFTRMFLGLKPEMKARDLQNDRARFYKTELGKTLQRAGATSGFQSVDENNKYINTQSLRGDIYRAAPNIQTLEDEGVTYSQLGLKNAGTGVDGKPVTPTTITQRAQSFKDLKQVNNALKELGVTPTAGASYPELQLQLKKAAVQNRRDNARIADEIEFGTAGTDGQPNVGGTQGGRIKLQEADDVSKASKETVIASQARTKLAREIASRNLSQQNWQNKRTEYEYGDAKNEQRIQRQYDADRDDARFAANLGTIKLQNAAEMERYELMLQNDREVRQSEDIGDLVASLIALNGAFMI